MNVLDMYNYVARLVDDTPLTDDVIGWLNAGQNILAAESQANFPQLLTSVQDPTLVGTFSFPAKWHFIPCVYAAAMYKAQDASFQEEQLFLGQFNDLKKTFVQYYDIPKQYADSPTTAQFTAIAGQQAFVITQDTYDPSTGDLTVYVNGVKTKNFTIPANLNPISTAVFTTTNTTSDNPNSFTLGVALNAGDTVTAMWEEHFDLVDPPYSFWRW